MSPTLVELASRHLPAMLDILRCTVYTNSLDVEWLHYRSLGDPSCPPSLSLAVEVDGDMVGFVVCRLRNNEGAIKMFAVAPAYRRQGLASTLFDELEARLRSLCVRQVTVGALGPNYFAPGVDLRSTDAISFLLHRGYATDRNTRVDMVVDLQHADLETTQDEERLRADGVTIRRANRADLPNVAAFALHHFSEGWRSEILETARFNPLPLFIATAGTEVIGFAAYDVTGLIRFGPTGTRPDYRRRGIGGVLLKKCLQALRDRGEPIGEISWAGPIGFYARTVGAQIGKSYWLFTKNLEAEDSAG
ncbi:MAG: GNAT family N-acetyltransferase [Chloroflexi bacterium]|nr:GNAT family N-acetyltransferase [Chloroflexota bacterium]